jgi:hypothetical protein
VPDRAGLRIRPPAPPERAGGGPARLRTPRGPYEARAFLELFALCGLVVAQPLLSVLGNSPDFFIFHGVTAGEVLLLVALYVLVPPVALWGLAALSGLLFGVRVRRAVQAASLAALFVLFLVQLGKHVTPLRGIGLMMLAALATGLIVAAYVWLDLARQLLRFAAVGPLVFVLLFTFASPSAAVVFPGGSPGFGGEVRQTGPHPPIVMIILDELALLSLLDSDARIDAERYPNFARLAGDATWWRNATAVSGWTPYAVPAMLSGRMPAEHVAPHYAVYPENLFTLLGDVYDIHASESITQLCPPWHCGERVSESRGGLPVAVSQSTRLLSELVSPQDTTRDPYDDFAEATVAEQIGAAAQARGDKPEFRFAEALGTNQPVRFQEFVTGLSGPAGAEPRLDFLHLLMPHTPWTYLPDGMRYRNASPGLPVDGPWWGRLALQRHELQLAYTDALIGEVLSTLRAEGRYDDALVVLTADHGVALSPGPAGDPWIAGTRALGPDNLGAEELMWVPLFIKEPGQTGGRVDERNWQHVDLLPTLADYAGVAVPWEVDGISWAGEQERVGSGKTFVSNLRDGADVREVDGARRYERIVADPDAIPPVADPPLPELVGTAVTDHTVVDGRGGAVAANAAAFEAVDPASGLVPALVYGTVPGEVPEGTPLAIAVNGEVGAVVPVTSGTDGKRRFAGLIEETSVFVAGQNRLELFLVPGPGGTFHRVG